MYLLHVSSKPFNYQLDWLVPDRVIDVPVYQDVLAWGEHGQVSQEIELSCAQRQAPFICDVCLQCEKKVDYLLIANFAMQLLIWRSVTTVL
jgi:hypothetical protein